MTLAFSDARPEAVPAVPAGPPDFRPYLERAFAHPYTEGDDMAPFDVTVSPTYDADPNRVIDNRFVPDPHEVFTSDAQSFVRLVRQAMHLVCERNGTPYSMAHRVREALWVAHELRHGAELERVKGPQNVVYYGIGVYHSAESGYYLGPFQDMDGPFRLAHLARSALAPNEPSSQDMSLVWDYGFDPRRDGALLVRLAQETPPVPPEAPWWEAYAAELGTHRRATEAQPPAFLG